jgi:flagellin
MSLVVNTNVSSLTAQRALAYADSLQGEAMTRLSTGSKINSAADDAAGLAIAQRMTSQVNGLNMAIKNANDGIALTQSMEGALVEVSEMLQRLRELSVQASNDTNTGTDRSAIQDEVNLLIAEVTRVSSNTRYNDMRVLDGTLVNKQLQVGTMGGETIDLSIDSVNANLLGAYSITGDTIQATLGDGAGVVENKTDAADDFVISGAGLAKTIDVAKEDSAGAVAAKVNAVSGETGVTAVAKTNALLYSDYGNERNMSVIINGKSTGQFIISNAYVSDAIEKINAISGTTGVAATAAADNKILLSHSEGADITIENETDVKDAANSSISVLRMQAVGHDGESTMPSKFFHRAAAEDSTYVTEAESAEFGDPSAMGALAGADPTMTLYQRSTGNKYTFTLAQTTDGHTTVADLKTALNGITGVEGFEVLAVDDGSDTSFRVTATDSFGDFDIYAGSDPEDETKKTTWDGVAQVNTWDFQAVDAGTYYMHNITTGQSQSFTVVDDGATDTTNTPSIDADELTTALNGLSGFKGKFTVHSQGTPGTAADSATETMMIHGPGDFGSWRISSSADITATGSFVDTVVVAGDKYANDVHLATAAASDDTATVQGTLQLVSNDVFSVRQTSEEAASGDLGATSSTTVFMDATDNPGSPTLAHVATGSTLNDNYFTSQAAKLNSVSAIDLTSQKGASDAIAVIDGAINKISSMRSTLGAVENRLDHTVNNLMNLSEKTESARSRIQDADFASESAKLAKAQVLKQAGVGMLAQANATSQLVLQLLQ